MAEIRIQLPDNLPADELLRLRKEFYRLAYRVIPEKKPVVDMLEKNPGISLTKLQTMLRQDGVQRQKAALRNIANKCGLTYTD